MRFNAINVRRVLFAASCFTSAVYLSAVGTYEFRKALR